MSRDRLSDLTVDCTYCFITCVGCATRDHVVPQSLAPKYSRKKWVYSCRACNQAKGDMTLEEFKKTDYWRINCASGRWRGVRIYRQQINQHANT